MAGYSITFSSGELYHSDELYHHGILGMKWGVRRYQNADGTLTALGQKRYGKMERQNAKAEAARPSSLKRKYHIDNAESMRYEIERANAVKKAKGIKNKLSEAYGYKDLQRHQEAWTRAAKRNSKEAKNYHQKEFFEQRIRNSKSWEDYAKRMQSASTGKKVLESLTGREFFKTKLVTTAGRDTTAGKMILDAIFGFGTIGAVKDLSYRHKHRNEILAKKEAFYKERDARIAKYKANKKKN